MYGTISKNAAVLFEGVGLTSYLKDRAVPLANCEHLGKERCAIIAHNNFVADGTEIVRVHRLCFYEADL